MPGLGAVDLAAWREATVAGDGAGADAGVCCGEEPGVLFIKLSVVSRISRRGTGRAAYFSKSMTMTFGGVVGSSDSSGRPGASGSAGSAGSAGFSGSSGSSGSDGTSGTSGSSSTVISGSGVGSISEPGIVVVGAVVSGSGVGSSSEPAIVVLGAVVTGTGLGSGSDSEVSNGDVVVGAVDSEGFESEDAGSEDSGSGCAEVDVEDAEVEVDVDESAAWVGSDVGSLVAELVAELEGSAVCFSVEAAVVVSAVVFLEVVFSEVDVLEVGRSDGSAGEDASEEGSADVVLFVDSVVWEGSADWEDEEVAVGALAAIWGVGAELEDGVAADVV